MIRNVQRIGAWTSADGPLHEGWPGADRFARLLMHGLRDAGLPAADDSRWIVGSTRGPQPPRGDDGLASGRRPPCCVDVVSRARSECGHTGRCTYVSAGAQTVAMALVDAFTRPREPDVTLLFVDEQTDRYDAVVVVLRLGAEPGVAGLGAPKRREVPALDPVAAAFVDNPVAAALVLADRVRNAAWGWSALERGAAQDRSRWAVSITATAG